MNQRKRAFRCHQRSQAADFTEVVVNDDTYAADGDLPTCSLCGGYARPNILMFNDGNWIGSRTEKQEWNLYHWWRSLVEEDAAVAIIELGAGNAVPTVRMKSESLIAQHKTATLIRINPREHEVPAGHLSIPLGAEDGVSRIFRSI